MNINTIIYNEDLTIKSQTTQPIRAYAEQGNTIEIYAPVSSFSVGYMALQGLKSGIVNPKLGVVELLSMYPLPSETVDGVTYTRFNAVIPGPLLNDMTLMKCTGLRFQAEFWYLGDEVLGVRKYNTEVPAEIIAFLEVDFPAAVSGDYVRVIDTNTDFVFDGTNWADYESQHTVAISKQPTSVCDFGIEAGVLTTEPTHAPTNTELILQEIKNINTENESQQDEIDSLGVNKQDAFQRFDDTYLGVTIQTDIFPVSGGEETVMGRIEVARDINPATVSDIPTVIYFHGVVVNTAGTLSIKNGSAKAIVFGKAISGSGKIGFSETGLWVWIPISDNATKKNGLKAYISSTGSTAGQTTNGTNRILTITEVNTTPTGTTITADMGVTWGQHITLASGETVTVNSKIYSALKVDALLAALYSDCIPLSYLDTDGTLAANSDVKIATQKATKTYADTKIPKTDIDTDSTMAANSDTKVPSQKAVKTALALKEDKANKNQVNGYAGLDSNGKIALSQVPASVIVDTFVVTSELEMLALSTAEKGDVAVRTDLNKSFILKLEPYSTLSNWQELLTPTDTVLSVNGEVGAVQIDAVDIPYDNSSSGMTAEDTQGAIDEVEARVDTLETASTDHEARLLIEEAATIDHEARLTQVEADYTNQEGRLVVVEDNIDTINGTLNAQVTNNIAEQDFLARQEPHFTLEKSSPTVADSRKAVNLNRVKTKGLTFKELFPNGNLYSGTTGFSTTTANMNAKDGVLNVLATAQNGEAYKGIPMVSGHDVYVSLWVKTDSASVKINFVGFTDTTQVACTGDNAWHRYSFVKTANATSIRCNARDTRASGWTAFYQTDFSVIDLTAMSYAPSAVLWTTLSAIDIDLMTGRKPKGIATAGLQLATPTEIHCNTATPHMAQIKAIWGRTIKGLLSDGQFTSSYTGWTKNAEGTASIVSNKLQVEASNATSYVYKNVLGMTGQKIYIQLKATRVSGSGALCAVLPYDSLSGAIGTPMSVAQFDALTENTETYFSGVYTLTNNGLCILLGRNAPNTYVAKFDDIQVVNLSELGLTHLTTTAEVGSYFNITGYIPFGITNSLPTSLVSKDSSNAVLGTYAFSTAELPGQTATYGMAMLPNGIGDLYDGFRKKFVRYVNHQLFTGSAGESWAQGTSGTNTYYFNSAYLSNSACLSADTQTLLSNRFVQANISATDANGIMANGNTLYIRILKTTVDAMTGADALAKFKAWLTANNVYVAYLRTVDETTITDTTITNRIKASAGGSLTMTGALNPTTCVEIGDYYSQYSDFLLAGPMGSLPDGKYDESEQKVDEDETSDYYQQRRTLLSKVQTLMALPQSAVTYGWEFLNLRLNRVQNGEIWTDTDSDGLADGWDTSFDTYSIVSGKQVLNATSANTKYFSHTFNPNIFIEGHYYCIRWKISDTVDLQSHNFGLGESSLIHETPLLGYVATIDGYTQALFLCTDSSADDSILFEFTFNDNTGSVTVDDIELYDVSVIFGDGLSVTDSQIVRFILRDGFTPFEIGLSYWDSTYTALFPASCAVMANYYHSSLTYSLQSLNDLIASGAGGIAVSPLGKLYLVLPNATASTLSALYTYLTANPLNVCAEITPVTKVITNEYIKSVGNALTVKVISSTASEVSDFEADYAKDTNL